MPLKIPNLDDRRYQDILREALARIPVHTPDWTNFNESDPGVTLVELFAFLTENLLYRCNQIPERNRLKFLSLLGIQLHPGATSQGLVTFSNERGLRETITLNGGIEVYAEKVPFRTMLGLDVLPIEAKVYYKVYYKNKLADTSETSEKLKDYYNQLYASYKGQTQSQEIELYETVPLDEKSPEGIDLSETVGNSFWIALLARPSDPIDTARSKIAGKTLSLGIVPARDDVKRRLPPGHSAAAEGETLLEYLVPKLPDEGKLPDDPQKRIAEYKPLDARPQIDVLTKPGIVQITLPGVEELKLWSNLDPLELGVGDFPPALEDMNLSNRIITWIRIHSSAAAKVRLMWVGINATTVSQRAHVSNEHLPLGTGTPDQVMFLSKTPVIPDSVRLTVNTDEWERIEDLLSAGPEVPVSDPWYPLRAYSLKDNKAKVFTLNPESGEIRFGDGLRGTRPPLDAEIRASYDYGLGSAGNVGAESINKGPALPAGMKVTNPLPTWGGTDPETVREGEKQISRYVQHRDRLVTASDFETITLRTPGVDIGRVEIVPAFNPDLEQKEPGNAPGAVTIMAIPKYDPEQPDAPLPKQEFMNAICDHIDPRRLVTTEVFLRGPKYVPIWVSIGISVVAGKSVAEVREEVKRTLLQFLSPLSAAYGKLLDDQAAGLFLQQYPELQKGWPLRNPVVALQLSAVASRVTGVSLVNNKVLLSDVSDEARATKDQIQIEMKGLELPRVIGISVTTGEPIGLDTLISGKTISTPLKPGEVLDTSKPKIIPVPIIPEECS